MSLYVSGLRETLSPVPQVHCRLQQRGVQPMGVAGGVQLRDGVVPRPRARCSGERCFARLQHGRAGRGAHVQRGPDSDRAVHDRQ